MAIWRGADHMATMAFVDEAGVVRPGPSVSGTRFVFISRGLRSFALFPRVF